MPDIRTSDVRLVGAIGYVCDAKHAITGAMGIRGPRRKEQQPILIVLTDREHLGSGRHTVPERRREAANTQPELIKMWLNRGDDDGIGLHGISSGDDRGIGLRGISRGATSQTRERETA